MEDSKYAECPLIDDKIENVECITNTSCIDGILDVSVMPESSEKRKITRKSANLVNGIIIDRVENV
ncbi:MAG: hypothetical protein IKK32_07350 [Oscillospiraceae bacterium]|nr:hypothetical protein [Oscillospiraceae bacterium]